MRPWEYNVPNADENDCLKGILRVQLYFSNALLLNLSRVQNLHESYGAEATSLQVGRGHTIH